MEKIKEFIEKILAKEAECWTNLNLNDLDAFNQSVRELYKMTTERIGKSLGISEMTDFGIFKRAEKEIAENPLSYESRHLYKLSSYKNEIYGDIWVAYVSVKNPSIEPKSDVFFQGFILASINNELKIIGTMVTEKNRSTMKVDGWRASPYNSSDLDINKLGQFISTERYFEPNNRDDFSLEEYLKDK